MNTEAIIAYRAAFVIADAAYLKAVTDAAEYRKVADAMEEAATTKYREAADAAEATYALATLFDGAL